MNKEENFISKIKKIFSKFKNISVEKVLKKQIKREIEKFVYLTKH